ncbi:MAG TPA: histidine triad nucleotide-binding protein [Jatrophihabitans sp.]|nr:histidine triad nucleotide-binding protein [Jatrophihabitans sp.]
MDADCLFCKIVAGDIPATIVHDGEQVLAFRDVNPQAPVHVLVIPKQHVSHVGELGADPDAAATVLAGIRAVAEELQLESYRTVFNTGEESGQTVFHVHAHVLSGRSFGWPPG